MYKILAVMLCLWTAVLGWAEPNPYAHKKGEVAVDLGIKTAIPLLGSDWGEFNVENKTQRITHDAKSGAPSFGGDLQAVYFMSPRLAVGASVGMEHFRRDLASGVAFNVGTTVRNYLALVRMYVTPFQVWRFYVPLAAGMGEISSKLDMHPYERFRYSGFAAHCGLGVEKSLNKRWDLSFEARYNYNKFHRTKTNSHGDEYRLYSRLNYLSYSVRAGYRF